jgi:hypothetical protein
MGKTDGNPMNPAARLQAAPRCRATSKRSRLPCMAPAVTGWTVCRMHGAGGGAPTGKGNGAYRHGNRTKDAALMRQFARALRSQSAALVASVLGALPSPAVSSPRANTKKSQAN